MTVVKSKHIRLGADSRDDRAKISDAVAVLGAEAGFCEHDRATIQVGQLALPSGERVGLVEVLFDAPWLTTVYRVPLRTAARFRGRRKGSASWLEYDVIRLNEATVDSEGTVTLADKKTVLYAVEVFSAAMITDLSELDLRIIHAALKVIDGGIDCYRSLRQDLPGVDPASVPDVRCLDFGSFRELKPPPLKTIIAGIARVDPELKASGKKFADALCKAGIRVPAPRPRLHKAVRP